jgi:uncharacterized protein YjbI with pentapeptide repeats
MIIKGTFDLKPDQVATPAEEQLFPTGEEFYPGDDEMQGSLRYEADFAYFKPQADFLLVGSCHTHGGKPAPVCQTTFRVGEKSKSLVVFGDRYWKRNSLGLWTITEPEPFTEMELRYENSFGGKDYQKNPVGKGYRKQETESGKNLRLLPNIEDPEALVDSPRSRPEPAGFGPLNRMWEQRYAKMGTYKGDYLKKRWPWFPENFDWGHFNAAPPGMQLEGYLRGDEPLYFENMHSKHPEYSSRLPSLRVRCFLNNLKDSETDQTSFDEVTMNLDTLWVDIEAEKLVLVWRGWTEALSEDYEEVRHVFIMSEPLEQPPQTVDKCHGLFLAELADYEKEWGIALLESEEPKTLDEFQEPDASEKAAIASSETEMQATADVEAKKEKNALKKKIEAQTAAFLSQMGIHMDSLPPNIKEQQSRIISKLSEDDPEKVMAMEEAELENQMKDAFTKMGVDIDNLPPVSAKAKTELARFMKALRIDSSMVGQTPQLGKLLAAVPALLPKMGADPENLSPVIAEVKKQRENLYKQLGIEMEDESEPMGEEREPETVLTREIVEERAALGESFAGEDLKNLDLSDLDLHGLDFTRASLAGASLTRANLAGAVLLNANLKGTDLTGASLPDANLEGADLSDTNMERVGLTSANLTRSYSKGANLTDAELDGANLGHADFTRSNLVGANLKGSRLANANLTQARLQGVKMPGADVSEANMTASNLAGSDMTESNLSRADLSGADLSGTDLTGANLTNAILSKGNLEKACLKEADFTEADLSESVLTKAVLNDAIFEKANMKGAVLEGVEAVGAYLSEADLTSAKLSKSDFSGADLSKSILNGADFKESKLEDTSVEGSKGLKVNFNKADLTRLRASEGCDFTESTFRETNGFESIWHDAVLKDTDFSLSKMEGADFTKAILKSADFSAADMKHTRFMKADLKLAKLMYMNLFEGSFEKADLTGADLSGSNMFRVEFLEAVIEHTKMENTNLKMTKLG